MSAPKMGTDTWPEPSEMLARARAMIPALKTRALETENTGKLHADTVAELHKTGLFRMVQPARVGGGDYDYNLMLEVTMELGRGCGSTAWVFINLACHHWMLGMWPPEGQDHVWSENADALIASSVIYPAGRAEKTDGGYALSGRWPFCSGIDHSDWVMLGGMAGGQNEGNPDPRIFMVRTADLEVFDNWDVSGLCGTGSKDSAADNVFVPDYLTVGAQDIQSCATPGSAINPNPIFNLPQAGLFPHIIASPIIGMTEGATDDFIETNAAATSTYNTSRIASYQAIQTKVAGARAATAAARTMIRANCDEATDTLTAGNICGEEQKHRWRRDGAYVANLCFDALQDLYKATGGRGAYKTNSIQRHYRDASVGISHISMSWDVMGAEFGRYALGLGGNPSL